MRRGIAAVAAAGVLVLAGCGGGGSDASASRPTVTKTVTRTATATTTVTASPTSTPAPDGAHPLELGSWAHFPSTKIRVTKVQEASSSYSQIPASDRWVSALAESCVTKADPQGPIAFSWTPWSAVGTDHGNYPASDSTWDDFPRPVYPFDGTRTTPVGDCVKGWIMFQVSKSAKIAKISYGSSDGKTAAWRVG